MSDADATGLLRSPLHDRHVALGAKFAEFGGWTMPLEYTGAVKEHTAVRTAAGIFDASHLGKAIVRGPGAAAFVNACLANDIERIAPGQAQYTLCCADDGGVVDDLIAYLRADDDVFLIPNAANTAEVARRLAEHAPGGVEVSNAHRDFAIVAVQGPRSDEVLHRAGLPTELAYMSFVEAEHGGHRLVICRTGYTGERGCELVIPAAAAADVWDALMAAGEDVGLAPAGLAARDTLRTEVGYPLHGQDLSRDITPVQARLGWAVGWDKPSFWGRDALLRERADRPRRLLRGLLSEARGIPRPGMAVSRDGEPVGVVTSGTFSPTRRQGVALALLDASVSDGDAVAVDVRGRAEPFVVAKPPFVPVRVRGEGG